MQNHLRSHVFAFAGLKATIERQGLNTLQRSDDRAADTYLEIADSNNDYLTQKDNANLTARPPCTSRSLDISYNKAGDTMERAGYEKNSRCSTNVLCIEFESHFDVYRARGSATDLPH